MAFPGGRIAAQPEESTTMSETGAWEDRTAFGAARQAGSAACGVTPLDGFPLLPPRADAFALPQNAANTRPAEPRPEVAQLDLKVAVDPFHTGWNAAIGRAPKVVVEGLAFDGQAPKILSVQCRRAPIKTFSFTFPEAPAWALNQPGKKPDARPPLANPAPEPRPDRKPTRIAPPNDVIKLHDRLYYVLQPSLESLVATNSLEFPFEPFPYQLEGIAFLYSRYTAILADEMGLGKTMQAISTIRLLLYAGEIRSVLLICPKPLVTNWRREFSLWAPEVPLAIIEGDRVRREWQWRQEQTPVKIANYELLMRDRDVIVDPDLHFDLVVLDEAQRIKNRSSTTSQVVRAISRSRNWALTGTPIENSSEDLVGIFDFLAHGFLSVDMKPRQMAKATRDYILRRTKDMVLTDMPPKLFRDAELELTPEQFSTYQAAEEEGVLRLEGMGEGITIQHVFELVLRLKQVCNFDPVTGASSKLERLEADMEEVAASGQKAIIFSQWVHCLDRLKERLQRFGPLEYHGRIPSKQRDGVIERFRNDPDKHVILMSYGAGSVGLNLQFCRYVFLFDRWWNPAIEDQAINRAHRIGVVGSVTVTRMLTLGTIEERINQVLEEKRALFDQIFSQQEGPRQSAGLTQSEIFGLFNLRTPKGPLRAVA
jgi:SNF2 family DNA or RNA helicase